MRATHPRVARLARAAIVIGAATTFGAGPVSAAVSVQGVRVHESPEYTRVVFDTSGPVQYRLFTLDNPPRVVVDLEQAKPGEHYDPARVPLADTAIRSLRSAPRGDQDFRVVPRVHRQGRCA